MSGDLWSGDCDKIRLLESWDRSNLWAGWVTNQTGRFMVQHYRY
jgi:hypothetical protein